MIKLIVLANSQHFMKYGLIYIIAQGSLPTPSMKLEESKLSSRHFYLG